MDSDVSRGEEQRLRETIGKMRDERSQVAASILPLESIHVDPLTRHYPLSLHDAHKLDLENAVLMQELTAMREDRAELRAQVREVDVGRFPFNLLVERSGKMLCDSTVLLFLTRSVWCAMMPTTLYCQRKILHITHAKNTTK